MRTRTGLVLGRLPAVALVLTVALVLAAALVLAGCGRPGSVPAVATARSGAATAGSAAAGSAMPALSEQEKALKFGQCMRDNGVPDFPDSKAGNGGGMLLDAGNADPAKVDAAMKQCKQYLPSGGEPAQKVDPQVVEKLRKFAQCMRDNGFPNFPDPTDQGLMIDASKLGTTGRPEDDPKFTAAQRKCDQHMPALPSDGPQATHEMRGVR